MKLRSPQWGVWGRSHNVENSAASPPAPSKDAATARWTRLRRVRAQPRRIALAAVRIAPMIPFALLILYTLNLVYLLLWVNKTVRKCSQCAEADVPKLSPSPAPASMLILLVTFGHISALTFWGFTDNPYQKRAWIHAGDNLGMLVFVLDGFCIPAIGYFLYQCGKLWGMLEGRRFQLDLEARRRFNAEADARLREFFSAKGM
jgi:hypothetical protein